MRVNNYLAGLTLLIAIAAPARATEYTIDPAESIFAVVVHKAGIAARFAHNHLVYPSEYTATLSMENTDLVTAQFSLTFAAEKLQVDAPDMHKKWYPRIEAAGILDEPFKQVDEKDRQTIGEHMRGNNQLDAATYPKISAKVTQVSAKSQRIGKQDFSHLAILEFEVHGKKIARECPALITFKNDSVTIEAMVSFTFSEFGIKPYSALGGAVKNRDAFDVYVYLIAKPKS
ncbi:MAG: YceI family protein [Candidatus Hydrogenedentes bacterium]|nr:YceI family protein [Candidatus Hydrogenedentota bacterium]